MLAILGCLNFLNYLFWAYWYKYKSQVPESRHDEASSSDKTEDAKEKEACC
jgi:peptide/histidine transporter 3/4